MHASQTTTSLFWKFCLLGPCEGSGQDVCDAVAREAAPPAADETGEYAGCRSCCYVERRAGIYARGVSK